MSDEPSKPRFERVITHLRLLQSQNPHDRTVGSEVEIAVGILRGERPGIEAKYDALLAKLFRLRSYWLDERERVRVRLEGAEWPVHRATGKARLAIINKLLQDTQWIEARNRDLIQLAAKQHDSPPSL